jgi:hypothetical protein
MRSSKGQDPEALGLQNQGIFAETTRPKKTGIPRDAVRCEKNVLDNPAGTHTLAPDNMNKTPLTKILLGVLTLSALASVLLCWLYISNTRQLRSLQAQASFINSNRAIINALANDTLEYSKTHPAIDPLLESLGFKTNRTASTAGSKPATK